jgi:hypothetical protein
VVCRRLGRLREAREAFERVLERSPDDHAARLQLEGVRRDLADRSGADPDGEDFSMAG